MRFLSAATALAAAIVAPLAATPAAAQLIPVPGRAAAPATTDKQNLWLLDLSDGGRVTIWLRPDVAPKMVERIKTLTRRKFYDGLLFHRVIDGFMAQGGDPKGDGTGGSDLGNVPAEFNYLPHVRGAVSAAREGAPEGATPEQKTKAENSADSQFFIVFQPRLSLDKKYTVFGRVIEGMQYVDAIERGEPPAAPTKIVHAYIAADGPPPYAAAPAPAPVMVDPISLPPGPGRKLPPRAPSPRK
ncbi:peptidylprolyl isomerase [Sphingomonas donggukensis]|uniref:Peptidyl-prolyl cis-trans isomerase n=1 Tax=Sphingomonas donggukensis TaxID=2949093 RepID=A0ABY4TUP6_9SPHN|nr:peptidylprolyl isomerase [Sphingomonas donggukensis]URW76053.1 peptidylprolyl isomerase [Sphingomonas donggukensis]